MKYIWLLLLLTTYHLQGNAQRNDYKVDSVFNFYFAVFEMEISCNSPHLKYPDFYDPIIIGSTNDTVYINKYVGKATEFIQDISKIRSTSNSYERPAPNQFTINQKIVNKWKSWYASNRDKIRWSVKKNKPILKL